MEIVYNGISVFVNRINGKGTIVGEPYTSPKNIQYASSFYDDEINEKKIVDSKWWDILSV